MSAFSKIASRVSANAAGLERALDQFVNTLPLSREWIQREWPLSTNNDGRLLLVGAKVALLEAGTAWAIGSNRGAASSLRVYVENVFAWLYYKDHPVEFRVVESGQAELMLPKGVQAYIKQIDLGFEKAYHDLVRQSSRGRDDEYYYSVISQFVHAHPTFAKLPRTIEELAISSPREASFLGLSQNADEFISDNFSAYYRGSWDDAPKAVKANVSNRLKGKTKDFLAIT